MDFKEHESIDPNGIIKNSFEKFLLWKSIGNMPRMKFAYDEALKGQHDHNNVYALAILDYMRASINLMAYYRD